MKKLCQFVSVLALVTTILPPVLFFADRFSLSQTKTWMLVSAAAWYLSAPLWMQIKPNQ
ncbi:MAG: hypothetical protein LAP85_06825 [Acidobacteriia bacterium]|nr:hypothetical protein [Terriglobia bacterium]